MPKSSARGRHAARADLRQAAQKRNPLAPATRYNGVPTHIHSKMEKTCAVSIRKRQKIDMLLKKEELDAARKDAVLYMKYGMKKGVGHGNHPC